MPLAFRRRTLPSTTNIITANGNGVSVSNTGHIHFSVGQKQILLKDILHVPAIKKKLLSVKKLCQDNNFSATFDNSTVSVKDRKIDKVVIVGGVYEVVIVFVASRLVICVGMGSARILYLEMFISRLKKDI